LTDNFASEAGHWYWPDGRTCYTYTAKDGTEKNTTKREARKWGLVPSYSEISRVEYKYALENWKDNKLLDAADANPRGESEPLPDWRERVKAVQRVEAAKAPDLGTTIHGCIEKHLKGDKYDRLYRDHAVATVACVDGWCGLDGIGIEKSYAHPLGYGGRVDLYKPGYITDFKTTDFTEENLPKAWDNHAMQLAAGRMGLCIPNAQGAIIYVSTSVPGLTHLVPISEADLVKGWELFCALLKFWQVKHNWKVSK
jgi:hypothetical protein